MAGEMVTIEISKRALTALEGLKRPDEDLDAFILRLTTAARASGFFGEVRRGLSLEQEKK